MKIAQIGEQFSSLPRIDFFSSQTFLEYDGLLISIPFISGRSTNYQFHFFEKKKKQLEEFISIKKIPIVYTASYSDTIKVIDRNILQAKPLNLIFPVPMIKLEEEAGTNMNWTPKTIFTDFFEKYKNWFNYNRIYSQFSGTVLCSTPFTSKALSFFTEDAVFLPEISGRIKEEEPNFLLELFNCAQKVRYDPNKNPLPKWTKSYFLPGEAEASQKIKSLALQIEEIKSDLQQLEIENDQLVEKKRIFTASGNELEMYVEIILKELGFEILQAEKNRDDLIIKYGDQIAVVEIKGLSHSAGEKNAAQLEKWRATYLENTGINPKGILVVNSYRELPLLERTEENFPDQMLRYSTGREHCLITTVQLLTLHLEISLNPTSKETIIKSLFETIGRYPDTYKWKNYITML